MTTKDILSFISLAAIWGGSFLFMRIGVPEIGAYAFAGFRVIIGAAVVFPFLLKKEIFLEFKENIYLLMIIGLLGSLLPFTIFSYSANYIVTGVSAVMNSTVPMITAIIGFLFFSERITKKQIVGIILGVIGVGILVSSNISIDKRTVFPMLLILIACLFYALSANITKYKLGKIKPMTVTAGSLFFSAIFSIPSCIYFFPETSISNRAIFSQLAIGILSTGLAFVIFNNLIKSIGSLKTVSLTLFTPLFASIWGYIFLGEKITIHMIFGAVIILTGASISLGILKLKKAKD